MNDKNVDWSVRQISTSEQARAAYRQATVLYDSGDFPGAIVLYDKLLRVSVSAALGVNPYEVRKARPIAYCKVGRFDEAEYDLKRLLDVLKSHGGSGSSSQVMYWYLVARHKGDEKKAMDEWLKL